MRGEPWSTCISSSHSICSVNASGGVYTSLTIELVNTFKQSARIKLRMFVKILNIKTGKILKVVADSKWQILQVLKTRSLRPLDGSCDAE